MATTSSPMQAEIRSGLSADVDPFVPGAPVSPFCTSPVQRLPPSPGGYPYFGPPQLYGADNPPIASSHVSNIPHPQPPSWHQLGGLPVPPVVLAGPHSPNEYIGPAYPSSPLGSSPVYQQPVPTHPYPVLTPPRSPQFGPNLLPMSPFGMRLAPESPRSPRSRSPSPSYFPHMPSSYPAQNEFGAGWSVMTSADIPGAPPAFGSSPTMPTLQPPPASFSHKRPDSMRSGGEVSSTDAKSGEVQVTGAGKLAQFPSAGPERTHSTVEGKDGQHGKSFKPAPLALRGNGSHFESPTVVITKPTGNVKVGWPGDAQESRASHSNSPSSQLSTSASRPEKTKQPVKGQRKVAKRKGLQEKPLARSSSLGDLHRNQLEGQNTTDQDRSRIVEPSQNSSMKTSGKDVDAPLSYSAVLRASKPKASLVTAAPPVVDPLNPVLHEGSVPINDLAVNTKKKRSKGGGHSGGLLQIPAAPKPKMHSPITFNFEDILQNLPQVASRRGVDHKAPAPGQMLPPFMRPLNLAALSSLHQMAWPPPASVRQRPVDIPVRNMLDSTAPTIHRGKEREGGVKKKPSALKRVILKEREERRSQMEKRVTSPCSEEVQLLGGTSETSAEPTTAVISKEQGESQVEQDRSSEDSDSRSETPDGSGGNAPPPSNVAGSQTFAGNSKPLIHSRRFREYCDQMLDREIDVVTSMLLQELVRFQDRQYHRDPVKARYKRRIVMGLREVTKHLRLKRLKCLVISPNIERIQAKGGLDEALENILMLCHEQDVPVVFALGRRQLGRAVNKAVPVSVVGIFSYDGAQNHFSVLMELVEKARKRYQEVAQEHCVQQTDCLNLDSCEENVVGNGAHAAAHQDAHGLSVSEDSS